MLTACATFSVPAARCVPVLNVIITSDNLVRIDPFSERDNSSVSTKQPASPNRVWRLTNAQIAGSPESQNEMSRAIVSRANPTLPCRAIEDPAAIKAAIENSHVRHSVRIKVQEVRPAIEQRLIPIALIGFLATQWTRERRRSAPL